SVSVVCYKEYRNARYLLRAHPLLEAFLGIIKQKVFIMSQYIGKEIGGYRVLEQIGAGGMAKVYKAYQPAFDRFVALKILPETYAEDETYLKRFVQEAKIIARLEHRHILPVFDFGEDDKIAYLAMRYLQAGTLKELITKAPGHKLPLGDTARIVGQLAEALDYAHQQRVVHRDVKPSNVMIDSAGDAFLMDFGIAKVLEATSQLTATGGTLGTPSYMSPEQGAAKKVDGRSDVYSLGIILYELIVGRVPYQADTPMAVMLAHFNEPLPIPSSINPEVPPDIERVILRALAKKPEDRYQTAGELSSALKSAIGDQTLSASEGVLALSSDLAAGLTPADVTVDDRQLARRLARQEKNRKVLPWVFGLLFVTVLIIAGALIQSEKRHSEEANATSIAAEATVAAIANATTDPTHAADILLGATETAQAFRHATSTEMLEIRSKTQTVRAEIKNQTATIIALTPTPTQTLTYTPTPSPTPQFIEGEVIFEENFEDRVANNFVFEVAHGNGNWEIVLDNDNKVFMEVVTQSGEQTPGEIGAMFTTNKDSYYSLNFRFKLVELGNTHSPVTVYIPITNSGCSKIEIALFRHEIEMFEGRGYDEMGGCEWENVAGGDIEWGIGQWYVIRIEIYRNNVNVFFEENLVFSGFSNNINPEYGIPGYFNISVIGIRTNVYFDEIQVIELLDRE
ncbi:serine/threonine protein kinase, partial [Chloroflexota bacterium]